jgi:hypothetical protein
MMLSNEFNNEGTNRRRDRQQLENFNHEAIYDILKEENLQESTFTKFRQLKAKIIRPYHKPKQSLHLDTEESDTTPGEEPSLYQLFKQRRRQESRTVEWIYDNEGNLQTTQTGTFHAFANFMKAKYAIKITEDNAIQDIADDKNTRTARGT